MSDLLIAVIGPIDNPCVLYPIYYQLERKSVMEIWEGVEWVMPDGTILYTRDPHDNFADGFHSGSLLFRGSFESQYLEDLKCANAPIDIRVESD